MSPNEIAKLREEMSKDIEPTNFGNRIDRLENVLRAILSDTNPGPTTTDPQAPA
jgi:hypothetical protein